MAPAERRGRLMRPGEVSEWLKEPVLKTGVGNTTVGSNPTLSDRAA